jgi:hypothetical protein
MKRRPKAADARACRYRNRVAASWLDTRAPIEQNFRYCQPLV